MYKEAMNRGGMGRDGKKEREKMLYIQDIRKKFKKVILT